MIDPSDPPVMMIGPSAPNGPPDPIETADEIGLSTATLADIRLWPIRIASIASGIPCPRIRSEPNRAIKPMIKPPTTGTSTASQPSVQEADLSSKAHLLEIEEIREQVDHPEQQ